MVVDYRDRKVVPKNKPRRQPLGTYAAGFVSVVLIAYGLGVATGWFGHIYRSNKIAVKKPSQAAMTIGAPPAVNDPKTAPPVAPKGQETPPLTFFDTLPKGEKAVIGSGMNPQRHDQPAAVQSQPQPPTAPAPTPPPPAPAPAKPQPPPVAAKPAPPQPPAKAPAPAPKEPQAAKKDDSPKKFTVQVASFRERSDADEIRDRLVSNGYKASVVEIRVPEKGVWYRVQAGVHLRKSEAKELAQKLGSKAIAVPE